MNMPLMISEIYSFEIMANGGCHNGQGGVNSLFGFSPKGRDGNQRSTDHQEQIDIVQPQGDIIGVVHWRVLRGGDRRTSEDRSGYPGPG